jgi:hypothetical protein
MNAIEVHSVSRLFFTSVNHVLRPSAPVGPRHNFYFLALYEDSAGSDAIVTGNHGNHCTGNHAAGSTWFLTGVVGDRPRPGMLVFHRSELLALRDRWFPLLDWNLSLQLWPLAAEAWPAASTRADPRLWNVVPGLPPPAAWRAEEAAARSRDQRLDPAPADCDMAATLAAATPDDGARLRQWACAICMEGIDTNSALVVAHPPPPAAQQRLHVFHRACLARWRTSQFEDRCPTCMLPCAPSPLPAAWRSGHTTLHARIGVNVYLVSTS